HSCLGTVRRPPTSTPFPYTTLFRSSKGLGLAVGRIAVDPDFWFFRAHFHQDPVWPGSLGLESFLQLLKYAAWKRWNPRTTSRTRDRKSTRLNSSHLGTSYAVLCLNK